MYLKIKAAAKNMNMFFKNKMSESPTISAINNTIKNIGYIALCISILLFLIIKILKYMLARKKFKLNMSLSQLNTPISKSPLNRSFTP